LSSVLLIDVKRQVVEQITQVASKQRDGRHEQSFVYYGIYDGFTLVSISGRLTYLFSGKQSSATGLLIARALVQLLTHMPNLLSDAAPYFIGIAPGINRFVVARKGL
jgi:hypothetical protein